MKISVKRKLPAIDIKIFEIKNDKRRFHKIIVNIHEILSLGQKMIRLWIDRGTPN
jgi:hypothetical protein